MRKIIIMVIAVMVSMTWASVGLAERDPGKTQDDYSNANPAKSVKQTTDAQNTQVNEVQRMEALHNVKLVEPPKPPIVMLPTYFPAFNYYYWDSGKQVSLYSNGRTLSVTTRDAFMYVLPMNSAAPVSSNITVSPKPGDLPRIIFSNTYVLDWMTNEITYTECHEACMMKTIKPSNDPAYIDALKVIKEKVDKAIALSIKPLPNSRLGYYVQGAKTAEPGTVPPKPEDPNYGVGVIWPPHYPQKQLVLASKLIGEIIAKYDKPVAPPSSVTVPADATHPYTSVFTNSNDKISIDRYYQLKSSNTGGSVNVAKSTYELDKKTGVITITSRYNSVPMPAGMTSNSLGATKKVIKPGDPSYRVILNSMISMTNDAIKRVSNTAEKQVLRGIVNVLNQWLRPISHPMPLPSSSPTPYPSPSAPTM